MRDFSNLVEAINILKKEGYTEDFDLESDCISCSSNKLKLHPDQFHIDEYYRFEGTSSPDDSSILYAISSFIEDQGADGERIWHLCRRYNCRDGQKAGYAIRGTDPQNVYQRGGFRIHSLST